MSEQSFTGADLYSRPAEIDRQEKCYRYWEVGQGKEGVMAMAGRKRVCRHNVFDSDFSKLDSRFEL